ncbi:MAG: anti-sigma factor [Bacteroidia bacterium]|jgi:anti-sigma-K factor RskA|nr:anti-sigma factor [Bacteroidia bacterium]
MDVKEYIESGIVELYAMGNLSSTERMEFEQRLLLYPELRAELDRVQQALEQYAEAHSINPRPSTRRRLMDHVREQQRSESGEAQRDRSFYLTYKYLIAASLAALFISTFASWFFYSRWNDAEERYTAVLQEKQSLSLNLNTLQASFDKLYADHMIGRDPDVRILTLAMADSSAKPMARIYWNPRSHETWVEVLEPMPAENGMQYQLWAMEADTPVNAGMFDMPEEDGMFRVKDVAIATAWAVTVEPKGGSERPTMERKVMVTPGS